MVAINHSHDDGEQSKCPTCRFRNRLAQEIEGAAECRERHWDDLQGNLVDLMFEASWALHRSRRERFTSAHDDVANAWEAATKLVELFSLLDDLRLQLAGDGQADELEGE